jgi:hypothetical protein
MSFNLTVRMGGKAHPPTRGEPRVEFFDTLTRVPLIRAYRRVDIAGPGEDSTRQVGDGPEPVPGQELRHLHAPSPRTAHDYDLLRGIQFADPRGDFGHRNVQDLGNTRRVELPLFPHVDHDRARPRIAAPLELCGRNLVHHGWTSLEDA